ncbi:hypothetical protein [Acinetobacter sp. ANC 4641]|uniref:hypothetical protein n=1 Tax=Acinetobacter sp. ANC 4641 TaxID=2529847 RepID=UPI00103CEC5F|nr:hypothetical protein [Acinetobacter sp. ANC 4641]TCB11418.1 hypothetical protein E0H78_07230 [Acinetobacter sp. ANC 4641]
MKKFIAKVSDAKVGEVLKGTSPGTKHSAFTVKKVSKSFKLKYANSPTAIILNAKVGDEVCFVS